MRRWKNSLFAALLTVAALAQSSSELLTPEMKRVGGRLACLCGSCNNTVGDCAMLECHYSRPMRQRIIAMQKLGMSDDEIVNAVKKEKGLQALASPPDEGFNLLAWLMPWIAVSLGLVAIWLFVRRLNRKKVAAASAAAELDPEVLNRYRENIEKDLAKLE